MKFIKRYTTCDFHGLYAFFLEGIYLVLHEGNQRRDNDAYSVHHHCWKLKTQRFTAAGRQKSDCVSPVKYRCNYFFLRWPKGRVSPKLNKDVSSIFQYNFLRISKICCTRFFTGPTGTS